MNNAQQEADLALATYIAEALNDRKSLGLHVSYVRTYTKDSLLEILNKALTKPGVNNRAAYYTTSVKYNGIPKNSRD